MQIGQGISHPSTFAAAKGWRRRRADDAPPACRSGSGSPPGDGVARPYPRRVNLTVMSGDELERRLSDLFSRHGYTVWPVPSRGEVGAALLICRGDQGLVVQVKRWNCALGPEVVHAVVGALQHHVGMLGRLGCAQIGGMVVATADFTPEARQLAAGCGVLLWNRADLEAQLLADLARWGAS